MLVLGITEITLISVLRTETETILVSLRLQALVVRKQESGGMMRLQGFEPWKALSQQVLGLPHLAALAQPPMNLREMPIIYSCLMLVFVLGNACVYLLCPGVQAAGHVLDVRKAFFLPFFCENAGTDACSAVENNVFAVEPCRIELFRRNVNVALDVGDSSFVQRPDINENEVRVLVFEPQGYNLRKNVRH